MADTKKEVVTTGPTFTREGVLVPPNTPIMVDADIADAESKKGKDDGPKAAVPYDPGSYVAPAPIQVAAIGPTGPNPTQPQAIPPGAYQTLGGYTDAAGVQLVAETTNAPAAAAPTDAGPVVEEGGPATGSSTAKQPEPGPLDQSVDKLNASLATINDPKVIDQLIADETAGKSRASALAALNARKEALTLS